MCGPSKNEETSAAENPYFPSVMAKARRKFHLSPSSFANVFTYTLFTVFPVIMFSIILVLKLRGNYLQQIDHLQSTVSKLGLQANSCLADADLRTRRVHILEQYQERCRDTLGRASQTLASLNGAFRAQWERTDRALNETRRQKGGGSDDAAEKRTLLLLGQNEMLRRQLEETNMRLSNVSSSKAELEGQLGRVRIDLDGLKSNTSRLEGEKMGLEKVLEVSAGGKSLAEKKRGRKKGESEEEDEEKKKEKESIEKIVKEHIQKLGLASTTNATAINNNNSSSSNNNSNNRDGAAKLAPATNLTSSSSSSQGNSKSRK